MVESLANAKPKRLEIDDLTKNNFMQLQTILKSNKFDGVDDLEVKKWVDSGAKLGYFNDVPCGGIAWKQQGAIVYILVLAVLPAYQGIGMGKALMNDLLENRKAVKPSLLETKPTTIAVQTLENVKGFFEKLGFEKVQDGDSLSSSFNQKSALPADGNKLWLKISI